LNGLQGSSPHSQAFLDISSSRDLYFLTMVGWENRHKEAHSATTAEKETHIFKTDTVRFVRLRREYNEERRHSAPSNATPEEFGAQVEPKKATLNPGLEAVTNELAYSKSC